MTFVRMNLSPDRPPLRPGQIESFGGLYQGQRLDWVDPNAAWIAFDVDRRFKPVTVLALGARVVGPFVQDSAIMRQDFPAVPDPAFIVVQGMHQSSSMGTAWDPVFVPLTLNLAEADCGIRPYEDSQGNPAGWSPSYLRLPIPPPEAG